MAFVVRVTFITFEAVTIPIDAPCIRTTANAGTTILNGKLIIEISQSTLF